MKNTKHTPGPWRIVKHYESITDIGPLSGGIGKLANGQYGCLCVNEANAHLIAAAPDMIALLKDILTWDGILPHSKQRIQNVISKAEGAL